MAKAMLIMEMPSNCRECQMSIKSKSENCIYCVPQRKWIDKYSKERNSYCPLREVPHKKEYNHYQEGYNACIDEILGGGWRVMFRNKEDFGMFLVCLFVVVVAGMLKV